MTPNTDRRRALRLTASAAAVAVAGCLGSDATDDGDDGESGVTEPDDERGTLGHPAENVEVGATSTPTPAFEPRIAHVERGGTVTWVMEDGRHDVTAYHPDTHGPQRIPDGAEPWRSEALREGDRFERTFDVEGVYDYVDTRLLCASHEVVGAIGRIVVGEPTLDEELALADPQPTLPSEARRRIDEFNEKTRAVLGD